MSCVSKCNFAHTVLHCVLRVTDKDPHPEVIHCNSQGVHNLCVDGLILQINEVHFLTDGLQSSL